MIEIIKLSPDEWGGVSEETMKYVFGESGWDKDFNRVSYAILAIDSESKTAYGFATILEMNAETAYIQNGGAFPTSRGTAITARAFAKIIDFLKHKYAHVQMRVLNTNKSMLKLALSCGFVTTGTQMDKIGNLYLIQDLLKTNG